MRQNAWANQNLMANPRQKSRIHYVSIPCSVCGANVERVNRRNNAVCFGCKELKQADYREQRKAVRNSTLQNSGMNLK
jgi:hypothetical protein